MNVPSTNPQVIRIHFSARKDEPPAVGTPSPQPRSRWPLNRWLLVIALILAAHIAAIFIFGEYKFPAPRPVTNALQFQLANNSGELPALDNPTLFALPRGGDLASVGLQISPLKPPAFRWSESPQFFQLPLKTLGAAFGQFMQTNVVQTARLEIKPAPESSVPAISMQPAFAEHSTMQIEGDLAHRKLSSQVILPDWPYADVIPSSTVQAVVDKEGAVISAVLLPSNSPLKNELRYADADKRALEIARALRFESAAHVMVGAIIFNWRAVPPAETNPPAQ